MILPNVPMALYVSDGFHDKGPTLSSSVANLLLTRSPAHARHRHPVLNPACAEEEDARFDIGESAHALLLEGDDKTAVCDFDSWRSGAAKAARIMARQAGQIPLLPDQADAVRAMVAEARRKLNECPDLAGVLGCELVETTHLWQEGDAWCRCRPDAMTAGKEVVISYKTTANAEPDAFARHILNMGYATQAAFESRAIEVETGNRPAYVWLVSEVEPPFAASLIGLSPAMAELGTRQFRRAVELWSECMTSGRWPSYPERVTYVDPPEWAMSSWMERENAWHNAREEGVDVL